ncbi:MAG TPA: tetratricopeptide repeat protein [Humisphaera sp.]
MSPHPVRPARFLTVLLAAALFPWLAGCGGGGGNSQQLTNADKEAALRPRDDFEAGKQVPITADTHVAAGRFAEAAENFPQALDQYQKALAMSPRHQEALFRTAVVHVKMKNLPAAVETWTKYVAATNGDATAYANLGFAYELSGRTSEAESAYQKGVRRDPTNAACRTNYGLMLARKERFNEAVLQLQTVMPRADVHYNIASIYEELGRKEQAKLEYRKALDLDPQMTDAQDRLAALD